MTLTFPAWRFSSLTLKVPLNNTLCVWKANLFSCWIYQGHVANKVSFIVCCGGSTLAGCQVATKAILSLPSSAGQGRGNITKGSWVEIRKRESYHHRQSWLGLGKMNLIYNQSYQIRIMRNKNSFLKFPLFLPFSWV